MMLNATFNNISVISWRSVLLVAETGGPRENHGHFTTQSYIYMKAEKVDPFLWHVCAYGYIGSEPPLSPHRWEW